MTRSTSRPLLLALLASASLAAGSCQPSTEPQLTLTARPTEINDQGEATVLRVVATSAAGTVGVGQVTLTSEAGSLSAGTTLDLDDYGTASTTFSCAIGEDPGCTDQVRVVARWEVAGQTVTADLRLRVVPPPNPWEYGVGWDDGARTSSCSGVTPPGPQTCTGSCPHGFTCVDGLCILNGFSGGIQYTLRFAQSVDLDLHVVEPLRDGGTCEVFWGDPARGERPSTCGARSSLDLDSNAACVIDGVNIENIIFPRAKPLAGTYLARVDLFDACGATSPIGWELQLRAGSLSRYYCGEFEPSAADRGGRGSGLTVSTIVVPP